MTQSPQRTNKACSDCPSLAVLLTGSQILLICRETKRTKTSYGDSCDLEKGDWTGGEDSYENKR